MVRESRIESIEKALAELVADKERGERRSEVYGLYCTIGRESWWEQLDPEQTLEAIKAMKAANEIMCRRMGMELRFVTWVNER